jgi:hypothetical protein
MDVADDDDPHRLAQADRERDRGRLDIMRILGMDANAGPSGGRNRRGERSLKKDASVHVCATPAANGFWVNIPQSQFRQDRSELQ